MLVPTGIPHTCVLGLDVVRGHPRLLPASLECRFFSRGIVSSDELAVPPVRLAMSQGLGHPRQACLPAPFLREKKLSSGKTLLKCLLHFFLLEFTFLGPTQGL